MYTNPISCVQLNSYLATLVQCQIGGETGGFAEFHTFSIFINDLADQINKVEGGVMVNTLLMYADDIVIYA